ncbi:hypothetical protein [Halomonas sp. FME65]|uniref:hypothetical protein n=1 Tax=Halomonas sp. FME65 TaxID=2742614 RepID=UPI001868C027|nr:hypothetical protein [Halomonas sp. FME65]
MKGNDESLDFAKGVKVDHDKNTVYFCSGGVEGVPHEFCDGAYLEQTYDGFNFSLSNDKFGLYTFLYFKGDDFFVSSDSLMMICHLKRLAGYGNKPNVAEFKSRGWLNAITYSLLSEETPIEDVFYLLPGHVVEFGVESGKVFFNLSRKSCFYGESSLDDYTDIVRREAEKFLGLLEGLNSNMILDLAVSGGADSRALIGAAEKINRKLLEDDKIKIRCNAKSKSDFEIVESLSAKYSIPLNEPLPTELVSKTSYIDKVSQWALTCIGCYDPLYASGSYVKYTNRILIGGHAAGVFKGAYGWRPIEQVGKKNLESEIYQVFQDQLAKVKNKIVDERHVDFSSELYYLNFRSSFHSSRFLGSSLVSLRPLMIGPFVELAYKGREKSREYNPQCILKDFLLLINADVACEKYDSYKKSISFEYKKNALEKLGGEIDEYTRYNVCGRPENIVSGAVSGALSVANTYGFIGNDFYNVLERSQGHIESVAKLFGIDQTVKSLLLIVFDDNHEQSRRDAALGKLFVLSLVDVV